MKKIFLKKTCTILETNWRSFNYEPSIPNRIAILNQIKSQLPDTSHHWLAEIPGVLIFTTAPLQTEKVREPLLYVMTHMHLFHYNACKDTYLFLPLCCMQEHTFTFCTTLHATTHTLVPLYWIQCFFSIAEYVTVYLMNNLVHNLLFMSNRNYFYKLQFMKDIIKWRS